VRQNEKGLRLIYGKKTHYENEEYAHDDGQVITNNK
jgi:hypothetical protein